MRKELSPMGEKKETWAYRLPAQLACFLLAMCLVLSQFNPCDATSVSLGRSLPFIILAMCVGFFVAIDTVLRPYQPESGELFRWLTVSFAAFGVWLWVCTTWVPGRGNARFAYNGCWQWVAEGVLTLAVSKLCMRSRIAESVCGLMLSCAAGTVAYAIYQYCISMPAFRARFASDPDPMFSEMGILAGSSEAMQFASRLESLEPTGPFALTNSLAGLMAAWLVFVVVMCGGQAAASMARTKVHQGSKARRIYWTSLILGASLSIGFFVTLLFTKSRSAWLATILGLIAACVFHPILKRSGWALAKRFRFPLAGATALCTVVLCGFLIRDPMIVAEAGKSLSYRFDYWRGAIAMMKLEPWTGYGVANFQQNYNRVKVMTASESPADPHNFILDTGTTGGLPLLAVLVAILLLLFLKMLRLSRQRTGEASPFASNEGAMQDGRLAMMSGGILGFIGILLFGFFFSDDDSFTTSILFVVVSVAVFAIVQRLRWIVCNETTASVCLISACVVLVHLLASGGWMQPGLMNSVCVLVGIAFGIATVQGGSANRGVKERFWLYPVLGLLVVILILADFARTMCLPVLGSPAVVSAVSDNSAAGQEPRQWLELAKVDPFDPELPRIAANRCVETLRRNDLSEAFREKLVQVFEASCEEYIRRDPNQWMPFTECGRWVAILADAEPVGSQGKASNFEKRKLAYRYFLKAAELYPNSAQTQLQAAVGAAWCGEAHEARLHLNQAEDIDRKTTHRDRKLSAVVVFFPAHWESIAGPLEGNARLVRQPDYAKGEPIVRWLRTNVP